MSHPKMARHLRYGGLPKKSGICPNFGISEFSLTAGPNQHYSDGVPPHRGALRNVINAGRDAVDALVSQDERRWRRTAKSCGPDPPTLGSSWRKQFRRRRWQKSPVTGESPYKP
jgi:hypothetical protein